MPVSVENGGHLDLRPAATKKRANLQVYMKQAGDKTTAGFSSDEEEQVQNATEVETTGRNLDGNFDMVDLSALTDEQLKRKLLQYGVKAGPIVATTRALYERKLSRMMTTRLAHHSINRKAKAEKYSDSEEEEQEEEEKKEEEKDGSEQLGPDSISHTDLSVTPSTIENRRSPQSVNEKSFRQTPVTSKAQPKINKSTTNVSLCGTREYSTLQKPTTTITPASEAVTDLLMEMFPDTAMTPTGITATKRRSIKGAAGRPVQFKYPETPLSPATLEKREIQQRLVPLWVQIMVFISVVALLYIIYISIEEPLENPFNALLQEPSSDDPAFVSQDTHA